MVTPARRETCHTWDKVWALNRQLLEPRAPRHMAVVGPHPVRVRLHGPGTPMQPLAHVQPLKAGHVAHVVRSPDLWLEQQDVQGLVVGDQVLLIAWGNITITAITTQPADSSCGDSTMCGQRAGDSTISRPSAAAQRTLQQQQPQQVRSSATAQQQIQQEGKEETGSGAADGMESLDVVPPRDQRQPSTSGSVEAQLAAAEASMRCLGMSNGDTETQTPPLQAAAAAAAGAGSGSGELVGCQRVIEMEALLCLEASPKGVQRKVHWVPALPPGQLVPLRLVSYDLPCTSERLTAEDDAVACFDWGSRREEVALGDPSLLLSASKGTVVQLQRHGLYIVDAVQDARVCYQEGHQAAAGGVSLQERQQDAAYSSSASPPTDNTTSDSSRSTAGRGEVPVSAAEGAGHAAAAPLAWPAEGAAWPPHGWAGSGTAAAADAAPSLVLIRIPDGHTPWSPSDKKAQKQPG